MNMKEINKIFDVCEKKSIEHPVSFKRGNFVYR